MAGSALRRFIGVPGQAGRGTIVATGFAGLHDREGMFQLLDGAYGEKPAQLCFLPVEPKFDPFRKDPKFSTFLHRLNLA